MPRDSQGDGPSPRRPPLERRETGESHSDTAKTALPTHQSRPKHHSNHAHVHAHAHPQKHHHVGRPHARIPSSKAIHKQHAHAHGHSHAATKHSLTRPSTSPDAAHSTSQLPAHRRAISEVKLASKGLTPSLPKSASHTSLRRNRSHAQVAKRDRLNRSASGSGHQAAKSTKSQVHFDLGSGDPDDDWVDASGSNSPFVSRKGSLSSNGPLSVRAASSATTSRPHTPTRPASLRPDDSPSSERQTSQHKEYLTSRLLQRTPSHGAPPKMTADVAKASHSHNFTSSHMAESAVPSHESSSQKDALTSRFVDSASTGSGLTSHGSFYHGPHVATRRTDELRPRPSSMADLSHVEDAIDAAPTLERDDSVLIPRTARRDGALPAETSRVQQKLNLQRASSVLEPNQAATGGVAAGASPLIGARVPGFDGGNGCDPRVGKILDRTAMEYLVVRRYQDPVSQSLSRLGRLSATDAHQKTPRPNGSPINGKRSVETTGRHSRNVSMPLAHKTTSVPSRTSSTRTIGAVASFEASQFGRADESLCGSSLSGFEDEDATTALLRNLWDRSSFLATRSA
ncbi:hypothetical protein CDD82_3341 [Ophiocordyceps australis]|uniref:Uncharacterized protein n=1 Tax=Ophiocordyceps australis TaxID=1399860 RepID=A0A2C5ZEK5_9HYPO|nr:hypothetical protein CDD82_3341 [Ophiocordyceps australis]